VTWWSRRSRRASPSCVKGAFLLTILVFTCVLTQLSLLIYVYFPRRSSHYCAYVTPCSHARCCRTSAQSVARPRRCVPVLRKQRRPHSRPEERDEGLCNHRVGCKGVCEYHVFPLFLFVIIPARSRSLLLVSTVSRPCYTQSADNPGLCWLASYAARSHTCAVCCLSAVDEKRPRVSFSGTRLQWATVPWSPACHRLLLCEPVQSTIRYLSLPGEVWSPFSLYLYLSMAHPLSPAFS